jgi:hypothetical protein
VRLGAALATVYGSAGFANAVAQAFSLGEDPPPARPLVYCEIGAGSETGGATTAAGAPRSTLEIK